MEKILIADDEELMRQLIADFCGLKGLKYWKPLTASRPWKFLTNSGRI